MTAGHKGKQTISDKDDPSDWGDLPSDAENVWQQCRSRANSLVLVQAVRGVQRLPQAPLLLQARQKQQQHRHYRQHRVQRLWPAAVATAHAATGAGGDPADSEAMLRADDNDEALPALAPAMAAKAAAGTPLRLPKNKQQQQQ